MLKIVSVLFCCIVSGLSFSQVPINNKDSSNAPPDQPYKTKENIIKKVNPELTIYPNPANNKITLRVAHFDPGMVSVKVQDIKGKLVREDNRLLTNGSEEIIMFLMLKQGIYFIQVSEAAKVARKKLVVL